MVQKPSGKGVSTLVGTLKNRENPFDSYKVSKARDFIIDVQDIHKQGNNRLQRELNRVHRSRNSRGVLVTGVAGSGKSHLIARLYRQRPEEVLFFQVQALPGGTAWLKHILQCMVSDLEQPVSPTDDSIQLGLLIKHFIGGVRSEIGSSGSARTGFAALNRALDVRLRQIESTIPDPIVPDVLKVLVNLWKWQAPFAKDREKRHKKTALAVQWLKGTMVEDPELDVLGVRENLGAGDPDSQSPYLTVLRVFGMLTAGQAPIILVFDQLDTMEAETINSLGNNLLTLIGSDAAAPNYLVVTAGIREEMDRFVEERIITDAVSDVVFKTRIELPALSMEECHRIVAKRLEGFFHAGDRKHFPPSADDLFPFTTGFLTERLAGPIKPSPRRVLKSCGAVFEQISEEVDREWVRHWPRVSPLEPEGPPPRPPDREAVFKFLEKELQSNIAGLSQVKRTGPIDEDLLAETIRVLIIRCGKGFPYIVTKLPPGTYRKPGPSFFAVTSASNPETTTCIAVKNKGNHKSLQACLTRSKEFLNKFGDRCRIVLIRDKSAKPIANWKVCKRLIRDLTHAGRFTLAELKPEETATLQALDQIRRDVPDLIIPASREHSEYQVTKDDFSGYLLESHILLNLPFFGHIRRLTEGRGEGPSKPRPQPPSGADTAREFVRARIEAKKIYSFSDLVTEWANHQGQVSPGPDHWKVVEAAAKQLVTEGRILSVGKDENRILRKV